MRKRRTIEDEAEINITPMLEPRAVRANLERQKAERPESPLIVAAHPDADTESVVRVLDAAKAGGIESVNVATTSES